MCGGGRGLYIGRGALARLIDTAAHELNPRPHELLRADDVHEVLGDLLGGGIEGDDAYILGDEALQLG